MKTFITTNLERIFLVILFLITALPRFWGLGYSEFYGDETKTIYWNKTVPAAQFLLDQRKGPVQFLAVWFMEQVSGGFSELTTRLPFALAGTLSVFVLYFVVRKWFNWQTALIAAFLFSTNGLFIAFSRTAQYQSFLWLFGFLAILSVQYKKYFLAGAFLGLGFLSHYDAVFFAIPVVFELARVGVFKNPKKFILFTVPLVLLVACFYLPYLFSGYFSGNTFGYLERRFGLSLSLMSTFYTYTVYNPFILSIPLVLVGLAALYLKQVPKNMKQLLGVWFAVPFVLFEVFFSDPGTHIQQYLIPIVILSGAATYELIKYSAKVKMKDLTLIGLGIIGLACFYYSFSIFSPDFGKDYPWRKNEELQKLNSEIYLYGFPYNRGWKQISEHLWSVGAKTFYTNDNITVAEYYLLGIPSNREEPKYYIDVARNRMFRPLDPLVLGRYEYVLVKEIEVDGRETAKIYHRIEPAVPFPVL